MSLHRRLHLVHGTLPARDISLVYLSTIEEIKSSRLEKMIHSGCIAARTASTSTVSALMLSYRLTLVAQTLEDIIFAKIWR